MFSLWLMFCLVNFPRAFIADLNLPCFSMDCTAFLLTAKAPLWSEY